MQAEYCRTDACQLTLACLCSGTPIAYKMMTNAAPTILAVPGSLLASRGEFATQNLWVTPHHDAENFPAGDYPLQSNGGEGIGKWTRQVLPALSPHNLSLFSWLLPGSLCFAS